MPVRVEGDVPRAVPRDVDDLEGDPGHRDRVAPTHRVRRLVRRDAEAAAGLAAPERIHLARRRPHLGGRSVGERRDTTDVVDVGVRDQDPARSRAHPRELEPERCRVVAGIDHRSLRRAALASDDVAVRLERPHHEAVDDERHASV